MNVRTKLISVLGLLFACMIAGEIVVQQRVLMPSFAELERDDARTSMKRIASALDVSFDALALLAADWGDWAELYRYVKSPNPEFRANNVTSSEMQRLGIDVLLIVDSQGTVVAGGGRKADGDGAARLDVADWTALPPEFPWRQALPRGVRVRGLLRTSLGIMMLAGAPVLDGGGGGRPLGMVIMGRLLTSAELRQLGAKAHANFVMTPARGGLGADRVVETESATQVSRLMTDVYGRPLISFQVEVERKITERGRIAVTYAATCLVATGVAGLLILVLALNRVVLVPLARVTRHAVSMGQGTDLTARLDLPGSDEMAVLAREFDRMVERVAESRRQLMDQSFNAGFSELAKGVLHNLGNAMTPLGIRLTRLAARLCEAPADDIERAIGELAREEPGSARYADLQEFLRLGSRELATALKEAQTDVTVIQRQSDIVRVALSELMHSTRSEHVMESVRLPDLVLQTLEIVPDACRQRLVVQADESLRLVGVVRVARTVLRLVLQNLIINAADAVRDAGRDKGNFRLAAEIVRDAGGQQLHLHCEDDGVGIARTHLEQVFEQGFSTKSRDTNHGIGLHWCANAVAALGGRIWADSAGPGLGASMHLLLPLPAAAPAAVN